MEGDESPFRVVFERGLATVPLTLAEERRIAGLPISELLAIADPGAWEHVAFEEAGEPGVLDLTTWLRGADGMSVCVVVTQNR